MNGANTMSSTIQRRTIKAILVLYSLVLTCSTAWALSLDDAKSKGLVGEQLNGYLAAVTGQSSPEIDALIQSVNQQRQQRYQDIAKKNNTTLKAVEALAGNTAIKKTSPGNYIQLPSGQWSKK